MTGEPKHTTSKETNTPANYCLKSEVFVVGYGQPITQHYESRTV